MEDKRYLAEFHSMQAELENNIFQFNQRASGIDSKEELIKLRSEQYVILTEMIERHKRSIDFMQGKSVEPKNQFGEAILLPVFGQG